MMYVKYEIVPIISPETFTSYNFISSRLNLPTKIYLDQISIMLRKKYERLENLQGTAYLSFGFTFRLKLH